MGIMFPDLTIHVEKELTFLLGLVSHHLHPEIVNYITEENLKFIDEFKKYSPQELNDQQFLFKGSDCVFPGVRRPVNREKSETRWKNNIYVDGTILNDNTYPRHIWSFLASGRAYSSNSWKSTGLNSFELAHVFGHKTDETELEQKCFDVFEAQNNPYALFTSASNVVLIPKGLTKPTDKLESVKLCYYQRHIDLYGENFFHLRGFKKELVPEWYNDIKWLNPILPTNWRQNIDLLLEYRSRHLIMKYGGNTEQVIPAVTGLDELEKNTSIQKGVEHSSTRFFVDEKIYQRLKRNHHSNFVLKVLPKKGKHPKGVYIIPNNVIVKYIETKREAFNWQQNKTYHQDGIPRDLKPYFNQ